MVVTFRASDRRSFFAVTAYVQVMFVFPGVVHRRSRATGRPDHPPCQWVLSP